MTQYYDNNQKNIILQKKNYWHENVKCFLNVI